MALSKLRSADKSFVSQSDFWLPVDVVFVPPWYPSIAKCTDSHTWRKFSFSSLDGVMPGFDPYTSTLPSAATLRKPCCRTGSRSANTSPLNSLIVNRFKKRTYSSASNTSSLLRSATNIAVLHTRKNSSDISATLVDGACDGLLCIVGIFVFEPLSSSFSMA